MDSFAFVFQGRAVLTMCFVFGWRFSWDGREEYSSSGGQMLACGWQTVYQKVWMATRWRWISRRGVLKFAENLHFRCWRRTAAMMARVCGNISGGGGDDSDVGGGGR